MSTYWSWKERHDPSDRFPRGESISEALLRHAGALRRLVARPETVVLLAIHEFGLHHIAAAAASSLFPHLAPHNAVPYLFGELALRRASDRLEALAHSDRPNTCRGWPACHPGRTPEQAPGQQLLAELAQEPLDTQPTSDVIGVLLIHNGRAPSPVSRR